MLSNSASSDLPVVFVNTGSSCGFLVSTGLSYGCFLVSNGLSYGCFLVSTGLSYAQKFSVITLLCFSMGVF